MNLYQQSSEFIDFIESTADGETNLSELEVKLASLYCQLLSAISNQGKSPRVKISYDSTRELISRKFPTLGYYNSTLEVIEDIGETELTTADAVDDLTDIYIDLKSALSLKTQRDVEAELKLSFELHIKSHMINLLQYLANCE